MTRDGIGGAWHMLRALGSPALLYRQVPRLIERANRLVVLEVQDQRPGFVRIVAGPRDADRREFPGTCWNRIGFLESVPTIWGGPRARVGHDLCMHRDGGETCTYDVEFVNAGQGWALPAAVVVGATATGAVAGFAAGAGFATAELAGLGSLAAIATLRARPPSRPTPRTAPCLSDHRSQ